jgi:hypothetical protein
VRLQAEHGVDAGARGLHGRIAALESGKRLLVFGGWGRSYRLLRGGLLDRWLLWG